MRTTRLYSPIRLSTDADVKFGPFEANYVARVLRLEPGNAITVFDGSGGEYLAEILSGSKRELHLKVGTFNEREVESSLQTTLVQGLSKGERMDIVVQKATELGVTRIVPITTRHSQLRFSGDRAATRHKHWQGIAANACQQCGRNRLPDVSEPVTLENWMSKRTPDDANVILVPGAERRLNSISDAAKSVTLLIGPEGGFADEEIQLANENGFISTQLGPRVLRTETAALVALTQVQSAWGDL